MAFADPQTVTIDGTGNTLNRVMSGTQAGTFVSADTTLTMEVLPRVSNRGRTIRQASMKNVKITSDPLVSTTNVRVNDTIRLVIDRPSDGYSDDDVVKQVTGFIAWLTAGTNANLKKLVAGEN